MEKEFLTSYEQFELEQHEYFRKLLANNKFGKNDIFPTKDRFQKLTQPISFSVTHDGEFWPQVPFSGSTIQMLFPVKEKDFKKVHGFDTSEIDDIIDFIKETGKIQFVLDWPPTAYEGLDYYDSIFQELKPPTLPWDSSSYLEMTKEEIDRIIFEFDTIADINFSKFIWELFSPNIDDPFNVIGKRMHDYRMDYLTFHALNKKDLTEELLDMMISDPAQAYSAFIIYGAFLTLPVCNTLRATYNYSLDFIKQATEIGLNPEKKLPCEIGKLLFKKLIHYPTSLTACKEIITHYEDNDLREIFDALNQGIKQNNIDIINTNKEELEEILDNLWKDKTLSRSIKTIKFMVPVTLGIIGTAALGPLGGIGGLLAGLGIPVIGEYFNLESDDISKSVSERLVFNYQVKIFDFKLKYDIH